MHSEAAYKRIVRLSAAYDLVVTAPFMTPWTLVVILGLIDQLHRALGLPGQMPTLDIMHYLFAGLMGSVVVVWSMARLRLDLAVLGRYDAVARLLFAAWQIYAVANGATPLLLAFTVVEIGFGLAQAMPYGRSEAARA